MRVFFYELKAEFVEGKENIIAVRSELKTEMIGLRSELNVRMDKLNDKIDKVIWFIVISILVPIFIQVAPHLLK